MKKAKILAPAIAALVLSSAAAVTGTVAWFTANLTATMASSTVTVVKSGSNLKATAIDVGGYGVNVGDGTAVTHSQFIDGSVDMATETVYKALFNNAGTQCTGFQAVSGGKDEENATQFRATKFTIKLSMEMKDEVLNQEYGVYVDPSALDPKNTLGSEAQQALRVGLKTADNWVIWAPYLDSTKNDAVLNYVNATSTNGHTGVDAWTAQYATDKRILTTDTTVTQYAASGKLYLGNIKHTETSGNHENSLNVTVYTWFEGSALKNETVGLGAATTYTLGFNAVKAPAPEQLP